MYIHINDSIVKRYRAYGLSMDTLGSVLLILLALYNEEYEILDAIDDSNKERRVMLLYQTLYRKGFLEHNDNDDDTIYILAEKGIDFVKFIESFDDELRSRKSNNRNKTETSAIGEENVPTSLERNSCEDEVSEWIQSWIELFPPQRVEGRYLRTNKHECADRMRWFLKNYGYTKDIIFKATKLYLSTQEMSSSGHTFTRNSSYFIFKGRSKHDRTSDLATWCQRILDGNIEQKEYIERDSV